MNAWPDEALCKLESASQASPYHVLGFAKGDLRGMGEASFASMAHGASES
jgi:hypothetical protein